MVVPDAADGEVAAADAVEILPPSTPSSRGGSNSVDVVVVGAPADDSGLDRVPPLPAATAAAASRALLLYYCGCRTRAPAPPAEPAASATEAASAPGAAVAPLASPAAASKTAAETEAAAAAAAATAAVAALLLIAAATVVVLVDACQHQDHHSVGGENPVVIGEGRSAGEEEETEEKGEGGGEGEKEDEEDEEDEEEEVNVRSSGGRGGSTPFIRFVFWLFFFFAGIGWAVDVGLVIPSHAGGGFSGAVANAEFSTGGSPASAIEETPLHRYAYF